MNSAKTTPASAGIGEERAMPMPAPRMKAAMAMDLPPERDRELVDQISTMVTMIITGARAIAAKQKSAAG